MSQELGGLKALDVGLAIVTAILVIENVTRARLELEPNSGEVLYRHRGTSVGEPLVECFDPEEFLARLLQHIPAPRRHQVRYYGRYSNVARARRAVTAAGAAASPAPEGSSSSAIAADAEPDAAERRRMRRLWARLLRRVYEVDPLTCQECGGEMRILAFILDPAATSKILAHLERHGRLREPRAPPKMSVERARGRAVSSAL